MFYLSLFLGTLLQLNFYMKTNFKKALQTDGFRSSQKSKISFPAHKVYNPSSDLTEVCKRDRNFLTFASTNQQT